MGDAGTRVTFSKNDSKHLKFGVDRILSKECIPQKNATSQPSSIQFCSPTMCYYPESCSRCSILRNYSLHSYTLADPISTPYSYNIYEGFNSVYKPTPVRPVPRLAAMNSNEVTRVLESGSRRKRSWTRAVFSSLQRKGLERRFSLQKYITKPDRRQLAATLGLTDAQVKVWFQNRRMKWRHTKESDEVLIPEATSKVSSATAEKDNNSITSLEINKKSINDRDNI